MNTLNITPENFTRINNDTNGNPRYVIHYSNLLTEEDNENLPLRVSPIFKVVENMDKRYATALSKAKKLGGKKYHNKQYGGGIVFQCYNIQDLCNNLNSL